MLIGAVPYLNSIPLVRGLEYDVRKASPADLDRLLRQGEIDIATAPVISLFDHPNWYAIPGVAIGTKKAARSVILCTRSPKTTFENVTSISLDSESRTSALLQKVLLACKYGRDLNRIREGDHVGVDAKLLIGDKALKEISNPTWPGNIYDLGQEWTDWTNLPFVFACWVARKQTIDSALPHELLQRVQNNLKSIETWIDEIDAFDRNFLKEYFTENMNYNFGPLEQQGLMTFHKYLREIGLIDTSFELRFVENEFTKYL